MADFSWADSIRAAFSPCLACLPSRTNPEDDDDSLAQNRASIFVPRARADELEGLLADADDADLLSLHSNIGQGHGRARAKRPRPQKSIKLFGYDLFGRPPIQLPDDEDEDALAARRGGPSRARTISASTLDADAAPLDPSTIARLSAAQEAEAHRQAKEERRRRRKEKKKSLQQAALAAALSQHRGPEFEGFPGSGDGYGPPPFGGPRTASSDGMSSSTREEFGPFEHGRPVPRYADDEAGEDDADFGGQFYASPARRQQTGTSSTGSRSTSAADSTQYNHHYVSQHHTARHPHDSSPRKKRSQSSRNSASSTSQTNSIMSPPPQYTVFPNGAEQHAPAGGFPIAGLGGGSRRKNSEAGVFLARRGEA